MYSASTYRRLIECLLVFILLPVLIAWLKPSNFLFAILWGLTGFCAQILRRHHGWAFKSDWNAAALTRAAITRIVLRFLPFAAGLVWFTWCMLPGQLFILPKTNLALWASVLLFYPPLSILPQEVIYRSFFLRRYTPLMRNPEHIRVLCALAFGWMHIVMLNWQAVILSMIGGLLFADTYQHTRSLAVVCLEHALYGCFIFTVGLGFYFFHANVMH